MRALKPTEAPMDTVLPRELTYEELRLNAEVAVTDAMRRAVCEMPIRSSHEALARDVALGVAMRAFAAPLAEKQRKLLSLLREWERTSEPEEQADLAEQMEMICYGWRREAEERI